MTDFRNVSKPSANPSDNILKKSRTRPFIGKPGSPDEKVSLKAASSPQIVGRTSVVPAKNELDLLKLDYF